MSIPFLQTCNKRKRRPKIFNFHTFGLPGYPISPCGPFRENIRQFLQECAVTEEYTVQAKPVWCTLLVHDKRSAVLPLYTVQENVYKSLNPFCDHCRFVGWSSHYLSKRRYHLIIPADNYWSKPLESSALDLPNHLLHGMIHANGYGHLLTINGIEGGSEFLCGREIMDLWDRVCTNLVVRKITVEDVSRKRGMDLRLLYGVAYGHPWFGRWGYRFHKGSFGVKQQEYHQAITLLSSLELDEIICDFHGTQPFKNINRIICRYKDMSETNLVTLGDLLRFMLTLKSHQAPKAKFVESHHNFPSLVLKQSVKSVVLDKPNSKAKPRYRNFATAMADMDSRWPPRRLEQAADVIVDALIQNKEEKGSRGGMTRQDVRDAARMHIGDTGLLDNVLKMMNNVVIRNYVVQRAVNPSTRVLEYTINEFRDEGAFRNQEQLVQWFNPSPSVVIGDTIFSDMYNVYEAVLLNYPGCDWVQTASRTVLDSKHFLKEWQFKDEADHLLTFVCNVLPSIDFLENKMVGKVLPGEIVILPLHSTIGELKSAAESAFKDTYCAFENFVITDMRGMEELDDNEVLFGVIESGSQVWMRGIGIDGESKFKQEGGTANWLVRCSCGVEDDDGERMVACDICEVWQHTRCCGIEDADSVPPLFVCTFCCGSVAQPRNEDIMAFEDSFDIEPYGCFLLPSSLDTRLEMELQS